MVEQDDVVMAELTRRGRRATTGEVLRTVDGRGLRDARRPDRRAPGMGHPADGERPPLTGCEWLGGHRRLRRGHRCRPLAGRPARALAATRRGGQPCADDHGYLVQSPARGRASRQRSCRPSSRRPSSGSNRRSSAQVCGQLVGRAPHAGAEPGEEGRAQRRRLGDLRTADRDAELVGLQLHAAGRWRSRRRRPTARAPTARPRRPSRRRRRAPRTRSPRGWPGPGARGWCRG